MPTTFTTIYDQTPLDKKLDFLLYLLNADKTLQEEFKHFIEKANSGIKKVSLAEFKTMVNKAKSETKEAFEQVDLENPDWEDYVGGGYKKHRELCEEASSAELESIMDNCLSKAYGVLKENKVYSFFAELIGMILACAEADLDDPLCSYEDVNDHLLTEFSYRNNIIKEKLDHAIIANEVWPATLKLLIDYCLAQQKNNEGFITTFQPTITALAGRIKETDILLKKFKNPDTIGSIFPPAYELLLRNSTQKNRWFSYASLMYDRHPDIGIELLRHLSEIGDVEYFRVVARKLFADKPRYWAQIIQPMIDAELDKELFIMIHHQQIIINQDLELFLTIRHLMSQADVNRLIDNIFNIKQNCLYLFWS